MIKRVRGLQQNRMFLPRNSTIAQSHRVDGTDNWGFPRTLFDPIFDDLLGDEEDEE